MVVSTGSPVVLVTGSSHGGIGYSLCEEFAAKGCIVYASARRLETVSSFTYPSVRPLVMDVTSDTSVRKAVENIIAEVGRVDIAVANAGIHCHGPILDVSIESAKQALDTNVLGVLRLAQAVFPHMAARKKGSFITIGSVSGASTSPWVGVYAATKAAAHAITETLQMEAKALGPDIKVMLVLTGGVKSNIINNTKFALPSTSLYTQYLPKIIARLYLSQAEPTMPAAEYARGVVSTALRKEGLPRTLAIGAHTWLFRVLRWAPKWIVMWYLWRRMGRLRK